MACWFKEPGGGVSGCIKQRKEKGRGLAKTFPVGCDLQKDKPTEETMKQVRDKKKHLSNNSVAGVITHHTGSHVYLLRIKILV